MLLALLAWEVRARLTAPSESRIAVRPFANIGEPDKSRLVDSFTLSLIRQLGMINGLQVRSQTSSFTLRDRSRDELGRRLGVDFVVEGSARVAGDSLLIQAALVSVADGTAVWSETFARRIGSTSDIAELVDRMTAVIVNRLRLKMGPTQRRYDVDIATFETYMRARKLREGRDEQAREAVALFQEVIKADPSYAPAKAALAATYGYLGFFYPDASKIYYRPQEASALAGPLAQEALEADEFLAEAHAAQGFIHAFAGEWTEADRIVPARD